MRTLVHRRLLLLRNIETLLNSKDFEKFENKLTKEESKELFDLLWDHHYQSFKNKYNKLKLKYTPIEERSVKQLRELASKMKLKNYNCLNKGALISLIKLKENKK